MAMPVLSMLPASPISPPMAVRLRGGPGKRVLGWPDGLQAWAKGRAGGTNALDELRRPDAQHVSHPETKSQGGRVGVQVNGWRQAVGFQELFNIGHAPVLGEVLRCRLDPVAMPRRFKVASEHFHQRCGRFGCVDTGVIASWYDEPGRPAVGVLEQKDGHDRPGGESLLALGRQLHLPALDEIGQDDAYGLLDLLRPSAVAPDAFRSGLDVHPAARVGMRGVGTVSLPELAVHERASDRRIAESRADGLG
jgi:hypothetical protein